MTQKSFKSELLQGQLESNKDGTRNPPPTPDLHQITPILPRKNRIYYSIFAKQNRKSSNVQVKNTLESPSIPPGKSDVFWALSQGFQASFVRSQGLGCLRRRRDRVSGREITSKLGYNIDQKTRIFIKNKYNIGKKVKNNLKI